MDPEDNDQQKVPVSCFFFSIHFIPRIKWTVADSLIALEKTKGELCWLSLSPRIWKTNNLFFGLVCLSTSVWQGAIMSLECLFQGDFSFFFTFGVRRGYFNERIMDEFAGLPIVCYCGVLKHLTIRFHRLRDAVWVVNDVLLINISHLEELRTEVGWIINGKDSEFKTWSVCESVNKQCCLRSRDWVSFFSRFTSQILRRLRTEKHR